jgi:hypothetical protein
MLNQKKITQPIPSNPSLSKTTCRVCLDNKRTATTPMEKENIYLVFKECTGFDVLLNLKSMPTHICNKCKANLLTCKAFLIQSKKTENILKQIYKCDEDRPRARQLFSSFKSNNENMKRTKMPAECPMDEPKYKKV